MNEAREAVRHSPQSWAFWNTLGVAAHRAGDWRTASEALEKSMALNNGGMPGDWAFLAMTRWKQHRPDEAREWLARAMLHCTSDPETERFRAEAQALLDSADPAIAP